MVGFWATVALNIPDFTRYATSQRAQAIGQMLGLPTAMTIYSFIGVAVTSASVASPWRPTEPPPPEVMPGMLEERGMAGNRPTHKESQPATLVTPCPADTSGERYLAPVSTVFRATGTRITFIEEVG